MIFWYINVPCHFGNLLNFAFCHFKYGIGETRRITEEHFKQDSKSLTVDEKLIDELVRDIQRALLQADVNVQLVFDLTKRIKKRALEEKAPAGVSQKEFIVKVVYDELVKFLGGEKTGIEVDKSKKPFKIMMIGLLVRAKLRKLASF